MMKKYICFLIIFTLAFSTPFQVAASSFASSKISEKERETDLSIDTAMNTLNDTSDINTEEPDDPSENPPEEPDDPSENPPEEPDDSSETPPEEPDDPSDELPDIPAYISKEANRVASKLLENDIMKNMTFLLTSDMHNASYGELTDGIVSQIKTSNRHAGEAMNIIAQNVPLDFFANLGDLAWGDKNTTLEQGKAAIQEVIGFLSGIMGKTFSILIPGNHDPLLYSYEQNNDYLKDDQIQSLIGGYRYKDFDEKKIRIIALNTAETNSLTITGNTTAENMSASQLQWFAKALDLSHKTDSEEWGIILLSHHPLDWNGIMPAANLLQSYLTGGIYSAVHHETEVFYNYKNKNKATVIAQFHGHTHCEKTDFIHYISNNGQILPTSVKRIAIPNACFYRNNEYGRNNYTEYFGLEFGESDTYNKVSGTKKDTAFSAVSIDREKDLIHIYNYGTGYDRTVKYHDNNTQLFRIAGENRFETAYQIADELKNTLKLSRFESVIIATGLQYADALSGSYLACVKKAPILLTDNRDFNQIYSYLEENLTEDGTVYILGGFGAVSEQIEKELSQYKLVRLAGATRFETNLSILKEAELYRESPAHTEENTDLEPELFSKELLICTGMNYADCLSASASGRPILMVHDSLTENQLSLISDCSYNSFSIIGGTSSVSETIEQELDSFGSTRRIDGENRFETSVNVASTYCGQPETILLARGDNYPDGLCGGILAVQAKAPLILINDGYTNFAAKYAIKHILNDGIVLGGSAALKDSCLKNVFDKSIYSSFILETESEKEAQ